MKNTCDKTLYNLNIFGVTYKLETFLEQREIVFLSPSKSYENLNSNFRKFCWVIKTQRVSVL